MSTDGIAFAGDWHGNTTWAATAIHYASTLGARLLLHAGDYGFRFEAEYVDGVETACACDDVTVWAVRGNHDDPGLISALPLDDDGLHIVSDHVRIIPDGHLVTLPNGETLVGLGGAPSIDRADRIEDVSWWRDEILDPGILKRLPERADIVLAHDCPDRVPLRLDPMFGFYFEDQDPEILDECDVHRELLGVAVDRLGPTLLVHGHYHLEHQYDRPLPGGDATRVAGLDCDGTVLTRNVATLEWVRA